MDNQPLVLPIDAITSTEDTEQIKSIIQCMFDRSHEAIRILPEPEHEALANPLTTNEQQTLKIAARRALGEVNMQFLALVVKQLIEDFMHTHVASKLDTLDTYDSFFRYCVSFDNYIDHVAKWIDTILASVERNEGNPLTGSYITDLAFDHITSTQDLKLKIFFLQKTRDVRTWHPYLSDWAWEAAYNPPFLKFMARLIASIQVTISSDQWDGSYTNLVGDHLRRKLDLLPNHTSLREFLANVTAAWNRESNLYIKLFYPSESKKQNFKQTILESAYTNYVYRRNISNHSYFSVADLMTAKGNDFDPKLLSDLFLILSHSDPCFKNVIDQLKISLSAHARQKCFKKVEKLLCEDIDAPDWKISKMLTDCRRICISYTRRWRYALRQSLRGDQLDYIKDAFIERVFQFIKKRKAIENIEKITKSCAEYLCGVEGPRQTGMGLGSVINFYRTIGNRNSFASHAVNIFLESIDGGRPNSLELMSQFCKHPSVSDIPGALRGLLYWTKEAEKVSERVNNEANERRDVQNSSITMQVSGSVIAEKYRPQYEPNLLRKPVELVDIDTRFATIAHEQCNLKEEQRLRVQNAASVVRMRTNIFGTRKEPKTLILTVYQYSIVCCLQRKGTMTVKDLCSTLKRADITENTDLKRVRRVMKLVLMSLDQPYQMIRILSAPTTGEIRPSRPEDISVYHYIVLNKELQIEGEVLKLPTPDLRISKTDEVEDEIEKEDVENAARASTWNSSTANLGLLVRCRARCASSPNNLTNEEETLSEVCDTLQKFGLGMRHVRFAVEILIQKGNIERHEEGGVRMLKFIRSDVLE